jgi:hypothetical protein
MTDPQSNDQQQGQDGKGKSRGFKSVEMMALDGIKAIDNPETIDLNSEYSEDETNIFGFYQGLSDFFKHISGKESLYEMIWNIQYLIGSYKSNEQQRTNLLKAFANAANLSETKRNQLIDTLKDSDDVNLWTITLENILGSKSDGLYFTERVIYHVSRNRVSLFRQGRKEKFGAYSKMGTTVHMGQFGGLAPNPAAGGDVDANGQPKRSLIDKILHPRG